MTIALLTHTAAGSVAGDTISTSGIDTSGASLLVAVVADYAPQGTILSDSKSNSWTGLTAKVQSLSRVQIYYVVNPTVGTGHTFTATPNLSPVPSFPTICIASFSGVATTSPFDQQNGAVTAGATSLATGSITPSEANELVVAAICFDAVNTLSIDSSLSITNQINLASSQHFGGGLGYIIQTTAAAVNPTWSWGSSTTAEAAIASFKIAAATGRIFKLAGYGGGLVGESKGLVG